jgi:plasmid stability protein
MKRNTTFNLDDELVQRGKAYAAAHGTTLTALVRAHLTKVTGYLPNDSANDPLIAFSKGEIDKAQAIEQTGLRDYAELLVALGDRGLDLPRLPPHEVNAMTENFVRLCREAGLPR